MPPRKNQKKNAQVAQTPTDELATKALELDKAVQGAMIGIGKINVLQMDNEFTLGKYNNRPQNQMEVNKMVTSFKAHGRQWFKDSNALAIVIQPERLVAGQNLISNWSGPDSLNEVKFKDMHPIILATGQHRIAALRKMAIALVNEEESPESRITCIEEFNNPTEEQVEEHEEIKKCLSVVKGELDAMGFWGIMIYNQDVIEAGKGELASHLSRNQSLHVYPETAEEKLVSRLQDCYDAYLQDGNAGVMKILQAEDDRLTDQKDSKLTKIWKNPRLVKTLMGDILPLGDHYRRHRELSVCWLVQAMNVTMVMYIMYIQKSTTLLRKFASKDDFPSYREVSAVIAKRASSAEARNQVKEWNCMTVEADEGDIKIFVTHMDSINDIAEKCFESCTRPLGSEDQDYFSALDNYRNDVVVLLHDGLLKKATSASEKKWLDSVITRVSAWLTRTQTIPYLLMTGTIMDHVWAELESVKEGYTELSRWFEPLLDTIKVHASHTHVIDDHTEALFHSIERERGMDVTYAVRKVWQTLFEACGSSVLKLHNNMSAII
ncbi:hypothetical protein BDR07DRAFT_1486205 [Suillus spraguei]|nr:hypothetical protein BDR07DRAFT_1486205 [Suillus spraguei]